MSIAIIITIWALIVYGSVNTIKKHCNKLTKAQEIFLIALLLVVSVFVASISKNFSFESLLFNIMDIFRQSILFVHTFAFTINSHIIFCINIIAILLVARGIVSVIFYFTHIRYFDVDLEETKTKYIIAKDDKKYCNCILRSCLARSPTA